MIKLQAHKGVSTEAPENTIESLRAAAEQGYAVAEIDVSVTRDGQFVLLHDKSINRTARTPDGEAIGGEVAIGDITYEQALNYDFGIWFHRKYAGTRIPFFADVLDFAEKSGIKLKIDNKYESFTDSAKKELFKLLAPYGRVAALTCKTLSELKRAAEALPQIDFHYDGEVTEEILDELSELLPRERLTVWIPLKNTHTSCVKTAFATPELCDMIKKRAKLGIWLISEYSELAIAESLGADIAETDGQIKPEINVGMSVDMHTHSEHSHDSNVKMADIRAAQAAVGTAMAAVTDHSDVGFYKTREAFGCIEDSVREVARLNARNDSPCRLLSGVEIGEGIFYPDKLRYVERLCDYDVIIGSVHCTLRGDELVAYSRRNFSEESDEEADEFMRAYFTDMKKLLEIADFDILAHLTCPLRYVVGKHGKRVDMARYEDDVDEILQAVIKKGIALEVNTSSLSLKLGDFLPSTDILKKYRRMGGYLITLGSDAHVAEEASVNFEAAKRHLKSLGFENIFYYKKRRSYQCKL